MTATHKVLRNSEFVKTTEKAYLIKYMAKQIWVPISIVSSIFNNGNGTADVIIPIWFAQKNGFSQL